MFEKARNLPPFEPKWPFNNAHVQSLLASSPLRARRALQRYPDLRAKQETLVLDCGHGVRLQGLLNRAPDPKGLVIAFHGWEGSASSSYLISTCGQLLQDGYDVFRLNFRDHGDTHHLNEEVFHSCRIQEVVNAVAELLRLVDTRPVALLGFSLGGNFALRVALRAPERSLPIRYVLAVCPPLNPANSLKAIEHSPWFYQLYFMRKWRASLHRKRLLFPHRYGELESMLRGLDIRQLTERLIQEYTEYPNAAQYLDGYSIARDRLLSLHVPATLIAAVDDPIIPVSDYAELALPDHVERIVLPFGGHCGFIIDRSLRSWIESFASERMRSALHA